MGKVRIENQPAFILHQYPYSETSLILDIFTREYGRVNLIAKGAKRPHSALRAVLQIFQPLVINYSGSGEVKTLTKAEWVNGILPIPEKYFISAYYMNELIRESCAKDDAHPEIFNSYLYALTQISFQKNINPILRQFEKSILTHMGFGIYFNKKWIENINDNQLIIYEPNIGFKSRQKNDPKEWPIITKKALVSLINDDYTHQQHMIKQLLRFMISQHFKQNLKTKKLIQELSLYEA